MNADLESVLAVIAAVLLIATPLSKGLSTASDAFAEYAVTTENTYDDRVATAAQKIAAYLAGALHILARILPVITLRGRIQK